MFNQDTHPAPTGLPPEIARVFAFFDTQNVFNSVKRCFGKTGYESPNFDPRKLANAIVACQNGRTLSSVTMYTGKPSAEMNQRLNAWWTNKIRSVKADKVQFWSTILKPREIRVTLEGHVSASGTLNTAAEKGVDLRIGVDMVLGAVENKYDVAILFSQDGDMISAVEAVHEIARASKRWIQVECAYISSPSCPSSRPIFRTIPRAVTKDIYDSCIDPTDYWPPRP